MDSRFTKCFYKISEASEIIGVPQTTLRFWEKEFPEIKPRRSASNQRYYNPNDLELLQIINYLLRVKGMKIEMAREEIRHNRKNISKKVEVMKKLKSVRADLEILLNSLNLRGRKEGLLEAED